MKALVKYAAGPGNIQVMDMPEPTLRPGHVIIEVEACGICGTDMHIYADEYPYNPPVILGHEFCGTIVEAAPDVSQFKVGERVTSLPYFSTCGVCEPCREAQWNLCADRRSAGSGTHGAMARYVLMPQVSVRHLPDNVEFVPGALAEPLACCTHGLIEKATIQPSNLVVVVGPGAIGLLAAQVALSCGATVVLAGTGIDLPRLEVARQLGVQYTVNVQDQSAVDMVKDLTGGRGADVVVECSGSGAGARMGYELAKRRGQYVQIGLFGRKVELDPDLAVMKEVSVRNTFASTPVSWDYSLKLMEQGRVKTAPLVSAAEPLEEWQTLFGRFEKKQGIKFVMLPKV